MASTNKSWARLARTEDAVSQKAQTDTPRDVIPSSPVVPGIRKSIGLFARIEGWLARIRENPVLLWSILAGGAVGLVLLVFTVWRSTSGPSAPLLRNESVYQNSRAGFRFSVPDGWTLIAKSDMPPGGTSQERILAEYKLLSDRPASLLVTYLDLSASTELLVYLRSTAFGRANESQDSDRWRISGEPETLTIDGHEAARIRMVSGKAPALSSRDVVAFRRGDRAFFFTGLYTTADSKSGQQIQRAIESVRWKN